MDPLTMKDAFVSAYEAETPTTGEPCAKVVLSTHNGTHVYMFVPSGVLYESNNDPIVSVVDIPSRYTVAKGIKGIRGVRVHPDYVEVTLDITRTSPQDYVSMTAEIRRYNVEIHVHQHEYVNDSEVNTTLLYQGYATTRGDMTFGNVEEVAGLTMTNFPEPPHLKHLTRDEPPPHTIRATFLSDPAHGWLIVNKKWLLTLHAYDEAQGEPFAHRLLNNLSQYSYVSPDGDTIALEEDCDAPIFKATCERHGWTLEIEDYRTYQDQDAHVRGWPRYHPSRFLTGV